MRHHAFSLSNPNRMRALIGGFTANQTQFNRADGAGYEFLADIVLHSTLEPADRRAAADGDALVAVARGRPARPRRGGADAHRRARRSRPTFATL